MNVLKMLLCDSSGVENGHLQYLLEVESMKITRLEIDNKLYHLV